MEARINLVILVSFAVLASVSYAQEPGVSPETAEDANIAGVPSFPYVAEIIGDNVYVRSGPGTNHYPCSKLDAGSRVTVVGSQFGWSRIVPPSGSFCWISTQYVSVKPDNRSTGTVTGNAVSVYGGSDYRDLIRSTTTDLKLDRGEKVALMGEPSGGYYKIAPPTGAYRWVSTRYTKPIASVSPPPPPPVETPTDTEDTGAVVDVPPSAEAEKLKEFYAIQKQMEAERAKPLAQQDYAAIRQALLEISGTEGAGKAARYADFAVKQIGRFELAKEVEKSVRLQKAELERIKSDIAKARAKRLAEFEDLGRFAVIGLLQAFTTYGPGHYRITDDSGKTLCYALPAFEMDLTSLIGGKVGLVGTIEPHIQTEGALVTFTEAVELK